MRPWSCDVADITFAKLFGTQYRCKCWVVLYLCGDVPASITVGRGGGMDGDGESPTHPPESMRRDEIAGYDT